MLLALVIVPQVSRSLSRSSRQSRALALLPCHRSCLTLSSRRSNVRSSAASLTVALTRPRAHCCSTVIFIVIWNQSRMCSASGLRYSESVRTVSPPSEKKVTCWLACMPWDCNRSKSRRLGLVSILCTRAKHLLDGDTSSGSSRRKARMLLPAITSNRVGIFSPLAPLLARTMPPSGLVLPKLPPAAIWRHSCATDNTGPFTIARPSAPISSQ